MKNLLQTAAQTLVETTLAHPHAECGCLCDAALRSLISCGCSTADLRRFPAAVAREFRTHGVRTASLMTPSGESGENRASVAEALQKSLKSSIELSERAESSLIGGAVLRVSDDVLDRSVRGALHSFEHNLTNSLSH